MNSGNTPTKPAAVSGLKDLRADSSSLMLKFSERAGLAVSVLLSQRIDVFVVRA
jgi:hypothetical protein